MFARTVDIIVVFLVVVFLSFCLPSYSYAEQPSDKYENIEMKLIKPIFANAQEVIQALDVFHNLDFNFSYDDVTNAILIIGPHEQISLVEHMINEIDVYPKQLLLEIKLIHASKKGKLISEEIKDLISKLKPLFAFSSYVLLDSVTLRTENGANAELLTGSSKYRFLCNPRFIEEGKGIIRLEQLRLHISKDPILATSLNIKNGETVVVGSSNIIENETSLILVVTARTVD